MKKQASTIPHNIYRPIYDFIDIKGKRIEFARGYGISNIVSKMNRPFTTELMLYRLKEFQAKLLSNVNFSSFNHTGERDKEQNKKYYKGLIDLINSDDFQKYSEKQKSKIQEEQKRMYIRVDCL